MKLLCVADHVDPLVYSPNIKERFGDVDMVLGAGDLEVSYLEYIVSCLNKPLWFVFGNHNLKRLYHFRPGMSAMPSFHHNAGESLFFGSECVENKVVRNKRFDVIVAGLGGSRRYNKGEHQYTELQMHGRLLRMVPRLIFNRIFRGRYVDILLTHAPPRGIHDREDPCHQGFKAFLWFMRVFKPRYMIHGHVHLYDVNAIRKSIYGTTTIVNAYDHVVIDLETSMQDNSYVQAQAEADFDKFRRKAWIQSLKGVLNPEHSELLSFHEIKKLVRPGKESYLGMKTVPLAAIVGSEDRYQDFSRHFFPKKEHLRQRWKSIDQAYLTDVTLPPIQLLKIGELYFVRDGNHRVSVALSQGVHSIDAEVIEWTAEIPVDKDATREDIIRAVLARERSLVLERTDLGRIIPVEMIEFTAAGRWEELFNHIEGHKYFMGLEKDEDIGFAEAARSWYSALYLPIVEIIRSEGLLTRFPGRTEADLYMWVIKHWHSLKEKYGQDYPLDQAASEYAAVHGKGFWGRFKRRLRRRFRRE